MKTLQRAETLLNQYRYIEAYELVENADLDSVEKSRQLDDIAQKLRQHFERYAPVPVTIKHQNNRALLDVYQLLMDRDCRSAREILESGALDASTEKAWLNWIDQVYQKERDLAPIVNEERQPEQAPLNPYDNMGKTGVLLGMMSAIGVGILVQVLTGDSSLANLTSFVCIFPMMILGWSLQWTIFNSKSGAPTEKRKSQVFFAAKTASYGTFVFALFSLIFISSVFLKPLEIPSPFKPIVILAIWFIAFYIKGKVERLIKSTYGYQEDEPKSKRF